MFQSARRLLHLAPAAPARYSGETPLRPGVDVNRTPDRHPAMRGLNVSPVHGRHCICDRCSVDRAA